MSLQQLNSIIAPYLSKAKELAGAGQPVVAYYCKVYAVSLAMQASGTKYSRSTETDALMAQLFDQLDAVRELNWMIKMNNLHLKDKNLLAHEEAIKNRQVGAEQVRSLALRLFISAEGDEKLANQTPMTVKRAMEKYLASVRVLQVYRGLFLEASGVYYGEAGLGDGLLEAEVGQIDEKSRYAKWRAVELKKRLESEFDSGSSTGNVNVQSGASNLVPSYQSPTQVPSQMPTQSPTQVPSQFPTQSPTQLPIQAPSQPPTYNLPFQQPVSAVTTITSPALIYDPKIISEAEKQARHAISALHFDDIPTAIANFQKAINLLSPLLENK